MTSNLGILFPRKQIRFKSLIGSVVSIDAFNMLYQFLSIIRLPTGIPLLDSKGNVTSHLAGIFYRLINLLESKITPILVFDGFPPNLKRKEILRRKVVRRRYFKEWRKALEQGDLVRAFKKSVMTAKVNSKIICESKKLLSLMGIPYVQAPSEGEAQAAYMTAKGDTYFTASQDYDSLLFGSPRLIRNLAVESRRFYPKKGIFKKLSPELIELEEVLTFLKVDRCQLIDIAILTGTDYNVGVKGIGPLKAHKLIRKYGSLEKVLSNLGIEVKFDIEAVREFYLNPPVTDNYKITVSEPKLKDLRDFLLSKNFNSKRVDRGLERLRLAYNRLDKFKVQRLLYEWFK